jgi:hypothetical protein
MHAAGQNQPLHNAPTAVRSHSYFNSTELTTGGIHVTANTTCC